MESTSRLPRGGRGTEEEEEDIRLVGGSSSLVEGSGGAQIRIEEHEEDFIVSPPTRPQTNESQLTPPLIN